MLAGERWITLSPVLFAKVEVTAGFGTRQLLVVVPHFAGGLNAVENPFPSGAAAKVRGQSFAHVIAIRRIVRLQQRRSAHQNSRDAESALDRAFVDKGFAENLLHVLGQSLERDDIRTFHLLWLSEARQYRRAVYQHRAAPAGPLRSATIF